MSENAIGSKSTEFIRKNVGIGNLLGLKNVNIYSFSLNKDTGAVTIEACSRRHSAKCPACGASSRSVHSSYVRKVADLPISGRRVTIRLLTRRFRCPHPHEDGRKHVFSERHEAVGWYRRRTRRAEDLILHTALETSARKAEHMMSLQGLEVSDTTCLRLVMREELPDYPDVRRIGIDDWSWRRGMRYGTQIVDQDTGRTIALLKTRSAADIRGWLERHRKVEVITRDRDRGYGSACSIGAPNARQIADKFHLSANLSERIRNIIRDERVSVFTSYASWLQTNGSSLLPAAMPEPGLKVQFDRRCGYENDISDKNRRDYELVRLLWDKGMDAREIAGRLHIDRNRAWMFCHCRLDELRHLRKPDGKMAIYERFIPQITAMCDKGMPLHKVYEVLRKDGIRETYGKFKYWFDQYNPEYTRKRKENMGADVERLRKMLLDKLAGMSPGTIALYVTNPEYGVDKCTGEMSLTARLVGELARACPLIGYLRNAATSFRKVLGGNDERFLDVWMDKYKHTRQEELASFWNGLLDDIDAVKNAIKYSYTNGIVEGKNHRLKNKKRECYGRAGFELLRRKVILSNYG